VQTSVLLIIVNVKNLHQIIAEEIPVHNAITDLMKD